MDCPADKGLSAQLVAGQAGRQTSEQSVHGRECCQPTSMPLLPVFEIQSDNQPRSGMVYPADGDLSAAVSTCFCILGKTVQVTVQAVVHVVVYATVHVTVQVTVHVSQCLLQCVSKCYRTYCSDRCMAESAVKLHQCHCFKCPGKLLVPLADRFSIRSDSTQMLDF